VVLQAMAGAIRYCAYLVLSYYARGPGGGRGRGRKGRRGEGGEGEGPTLIVLWRPAVKLIDQPAVRQDRCDWRGNRGFVSYRHQKSFAAG